MSETKYVNAEWVCEKPGKYIHEWTEYPYEARSGVRWRGQEFQIRITEEPNDFGRTKTFHIKYKKKVYTCGAAKWKWSGGSFGSFPENIISGNFQLKFHCSGSNLSFEEIAIDPKKTEGGGNCAVEFFEVSSRVKLRSHQHREAPCIRKNTTEIELHSFRDANVATDVVAHFDKDRLVLNTWRLGSGEDEYYYIVSGENLKKLFEVFRLEEHQRAELLIGLHNAFKGKDCEQNFTRYLKYKNIEYAHQFCL
jgi:hypothetical protein